MSVQLQLTRCKRLTSKPFQASFATETLADTLIRGGEHEYGERRGSEDA